MMPVNQGAGEQLGAETQRSICVWAERTFGATTAVRLLARAMMEAGELMAAAESGTHAEVAAEAADVMIVLCRFADLYGIDAFWQAEFVPAACGKRALAARVGARIVRMICASVSDGAPDEVFAYMSKQAAGALFGIASACGFDLMVAVTEKMAVNRARVWTKPTGALFHTRSGART